MAAGIVAWRFARSTLTELETGQRILAELEEKREKLRESMLRIAGAIHGLEEMAGEGGKARRRRGMSIRTFSRSRPQA
jgi:hypothetical protein